MSPWNAILTRILSISAERARLVEGYLRSEYRTLDNLSAQQIRNEYAEIGTAIDMNPVLAEVVASSYGL